MLYRAARARFAGGRSDLMTRSGAGDGGGEDSSGGEGCGVGMRGRSKSSFGGDCTACSFSLRCFCEDLTRRMNAACAARSSFASARAWTVDSMAMADISRVPQGLKFATSPLEGESERLMVVAGPQSDDEVLFKELVA